MESPEGEVRRLSGELDAALEEGLREVVGGPGSLGVLFSGGVDSSLLAWELRHHPHVVLGTVGRAESADLLAGQRGAERLGLPWHSVVIDEDDVREASTRFAEELGDLPWVVRTVLLALALAIERTPADRLVCGQGVDELFLGYAHYSGLSPADAEVRVREDLDRLLRVDLPRTRRIARRAGKEIFAPFLTTRFVESALRVPIALRLPTRMPKRFFRDWAVGRGLPRELAEQRKRAIQYGSGVAALARAAERRTR